MHLFSLVFTKFLQCIYYKDLMCALVIQYLRNPDSSVRILTYLQISYDIMHKYCTIEFTKILFVIWYLWNPDSYVRIQYYSQRLYSSSNIYVPRIIFQYPMQILFNFYPDSSVRIQLRYCLAYWFSVVSQNTPLKTEVDSYNLYRPDCKAPFI